MVSISILIVSVLFSALLIIEFKIHKQLFYRLINRNPAKSFNKRVNLPNIILPEQSKTLILALQTSCHFCNESAPFYKHLIEIVKDKNIKLIAILPNSVEESKKHLNKLGLVDLEVAQASLDSIEVDGTPTLILIRSHLKNSLIEFTDGTT